MKKGKTTIIADDQIGDRSTSKFSTDALNGEGLNLKASLLLDEPIGAIMVQDTTEEGKNTVGKDMIKMVCK